MPYDTELAEELNILNQYNLDTTQEGVKIHSSANDAVTTAAQRLFEKGITTQSDGGYLTELGRNAAELTQSLFRIMKN